MKTSENLGKPGHWALGFKEFSKCLQQVQSQSFSWSSGSATDLLLAEVPRDQRHRIREMAAYVEGHGESSQVMDLK
jgi:hypothetical protein